MVTAGVFLVGRIVSEVASLASNLWGSLARSEIFGGRNSRGEDWGSAKDALPQSQSCLAMNCVHWKPCLLLLTTAGATARPVLTTAHLALLHLVTAKPSPSHLGGTQKTALMLAPEMLPLRGPVRCPRHPLGRDPCEDSAHGARNSHKEGVPSPISPGPSSGSPPDPAMGHLPLRTPGRGCGLPG